MNRLIIGTAFAVLLGFSPVFAVDNSNLLPTQPGVSHETSKSAHQPPSGSADTSGGAAEQSSAPSASGAASANKMGNDAMNPSSGSADQSKGAREQSSAPPGSAANHRTRCLPAKAGVPVFVTRGASPRELDTGSRRHDDACAVTGFPSHGGG